jgi:hypothetical protein
MPECPEKNETFFICKGQGWDKNWRRFSFAVQGLLKAISILVIVILLTAVE